MASAAAGQNLAFGIDRGLPFPVADVRETDTLMLWGSNCADTMPPIMQWVYAQRDRGGALIVVDPRAHGDRARRVAAPADHAGHRPRARQRPAAHRDSRRAASTRRTSPSEPSGFDEVRRAVLTSDPAEAERMTGDLGRAAGPRRADARRRPAEHGALGPRLRAAVEGHRHGPCAHQPDAGARQGRQAVQRIRLHHRAGQRAGRARARSEGRPAPRLPPHRERRAPGGDRARSGTSTRRTCPRKGKSAYELLDALGPEGGIRALLVFGSNVAVASPERVQRASASSARSICSSSATRSRTRRRPPRTWSCPWRSGPKKKGTMTNLEGRVILRQRVRPPPPGVRTDIEVLCELAERLGVGGVVRVSLAEAVLRRAARRDRAGARADYSGMTYEQDPPASAASSGRAPTSITRDAAPLRGPLRAPGGRARFHAVALSPGGRAARRASTRSTSRRAATGSTTTRARRRVASGRSSTRSREPRARRCTRGSPRASASTRATPVARREPARRASSSRRPSRPTSAPTRSSRRFTGAASERPTCSRSRARSDEPHARVQGVRRAGARRSTHPGAAGDHAQEEARDRRQRHGHVPPARRARRCAAAALRYEITVFGEEKGGAYNRILLGRVLAGEAPDAIVTKPASWYDEHGVRLVDGIEGHAASTRCGRASRRATARVVPTTWPCSRPGASRSSRLSRG